jgi:hypothetical protein
MVEKKDTQEEQQNGANENEQTQPPGDPSPTSDAAQTPAGEAMDTQEVSQHFLLSVCDNFSCKSATILYFHPLFSLEIPLKMTILLINVFLIFLSLSFTNVILSNKNYKY